MIKKKEPDAVDIQQQEVKHSGRHKLNGDNDDKI